MVEFTTMHVLYLCIHIQTHNSGEIHYHYYIYRQTMHANHISQALPAIGAWQSANNLSSALWSS